MNNNPRPIYLDRKKIKQFAKSLTHSMAISIKRGIRELGGTGDEGMRDEGSPYKEWDIETLIYEPINPRRPYYTLFQRPFVIDDVRGNRKTVGVKILFSTETTNHDGQGNVQVLPKYAIVRAPYIIGAFAGKECTDESRTNCVPVIGIIFNGWLSYSDMNRYLNNSDYKLIRDAIVEGIYSELLHEFTHIRDIIAVGAEKDKPWGERKHERRAVMQQVVDEVLTKLEKQPAKKNMFRTFYFDDVVAKLSPRYAMAEKQMSDENLYAILSAVYQAMVENGYSFKRTAKELMSLR